MLKWSNLEFTFEVGGSLVAADAMFVCFSSHVEVRAIAEHLDNILFCHYSKILKNNF